MNKTRNNELIRLADAKLRGSDMLDHNSNSIADTYDGKTAALSVSVAMSDLLPTLANYYQDYDDNKPCKRNVLDVVATMIDIPGGTGKFADAEALLRYAIAIDHRGDLPYLKKEVIDCAIALKQVVRTYNLV